MRSKALSLVVCAAVLCIFLLLVVASPGISVTYKVTSRFTPKGMPLGGIGAGCVEVLPHGALNNIEFRNNWGRSLAYYNFLFALRTESRGESVSRFLLSSQRGQPEEIAQVDFTGSFPIGVMKCTDPKIPLEVTGTAMSSFIPGDAKNSALPAFTVTYSLRNPGTAPVKATLVGTFGNYGDTGTTMAHEEETSFSLPGGRSFRGAQMGQTPGYIRRMSKHVRILLISDRPRPVVNQVLDEIGNTEYEWLTGNPIKLPTMEPASLAVKYDAIWLMETPGLRKILSEASMKVLRDAVARGCGLFVTGGPEGFSQSGLHGTPIEEASPVDFTEGPDARREKVDVKLIDPDHPLVREVSWASFEGLLGYNKVQGLKPNAKSLVDTNTKDPLLVIGSYQGTPVAAYASAAWGPWRKAWGSWNYMFEAVLAFVTRASFQADNGAPVGAPGFGEFTGGVLCNPGEEPVTVGTVSPRQFYKYFSKDGTFGPPGKMEVTHTMAAGRTMVIKPGETRKMTFVYSWYFGNLYDADYNLLGHQYSNWFGDSVAVAKYFCENYDSLTTRTRRWHDTITKGSLGDWLGDAVANSLSALVKSTWWTKDGRFGLMESVEQNPALNSIDAAYLSSTAIAALFPDLDKSVLRQIAKAQLKQGTEAGYLPNNLGTLGLDSPNNGSSTAVRLDLTPKFTLMVYRDYLWTGDAAFLKEMYPHVKQATEWQAKADRNGDGLPDDAGADTFYDTISLGGSSSYTASLWLAGLEAVIRMAEASGDSAYAKTCADRLAKGKKALEADLWGGQYFLLSKGVSGANWAGVCFTDQLPGQWYAQMLGLASLVPNDKLKTVNESILSHNVSDKGLLTAGFLTGRADPDSPVDIVSLSPAVAYAAASNMLYSAIPNQWRIEDESPAKILKAAEQVNSHIVNTTQAPWDIAQFYSSAGVPRKYPHYPGTMSIWTLPMAAMGLGFDGVERELKLGPRTQISRLSIPFAMPGVYGLINQPTSTEFEIHVVGGGLSLNTVAIANAWLGPSGFIAKLNGKPIEVRFGIRGEEIVASFRKPVQLKPGDKLYLIVL